MKAVVCVLLLIVALVHGAEETKKDKRGVLGLGYGGWGHGAPLVAAAPWGHGLYGHGLGWGGQGLGWGGHGLGLYNHGLVSHSALVAPPLIGPGIYGAPLASPWVGHGVLH